MAKPFDASLKGLVYNYPRDWLRQLGFDPALPVRVVEADLSTVTAQADRVLLVEEEPGWLLNLELQSGRDEGLPERLLRYSVLLRGRHGVDVHSTVVLLRREADFPGLGQPARFAPPHARSSTEFRYEVVRLWQVPVERLLEGGPGLLPLAPLADVPGEGLEDVLREMAARLGRDVPPPEADDLWTATYILMGLRYPRELARELLRRVATMRESVTYQAILEEGEERGLQKGLERGRAEGTVVGSAAEARKLLLLLGTERFGPASEAERARIEGESGLERLEELAKRLLHVASWEELLG